MKRFAATLVFTTAVLASLPMPLVAQGTARPQGAAAQVPPAARTGEGRVVEDAETIRAAFQDVLNKYPRNVGRVLRMDPTLLNDQGYLASYPAIAQFVAQYPEVTRSPDYYLQGYALNFNESRGDPNTQAMDMFRNFVESVAVFLIVAVISLSLLWLIKSLIEHRRWLRMSRIQTEVHTKLLDRFSSSEELLAYMKTPAGSRFLESAPIAVDISAPARAVSAPLNRILWSAQAGIVLLLAGLALIFARHQSTLEEIRQMLYMMGIVGSFIGVGFIISAGAAYALSQRLGLLDAPGDWRGAPSPRPASQVDSAGL
jgi:hypothetical protein